MKYLVAIVRTSAVDQVRHALARLGVHEMIAQEVDRYGLQELHQQSYRGAVYDVAFVRKVKLELAVANEQAEAAIVALREAATSGQSGDGRIFVLDVERGIQISSGKLMKEDSAAA
jgi:nitrogen regulatory protein P-II 2